MASGKKNRTANSLFTPNFKYTTLNALDLSDKLDLQTPDLVNENIQKIAALFPNCVTETAGGKAIDFDLLRQELNHKVVEGAKERYRLEWPGKREAIVTANLPTTKTLRPVPEESVNFDTTENLYIEGDNLEVLKLLQESYLGKIKMIYIDPPYNTGGDFVYKDNFAQNVEEFKLDDAQIDELGYRLVPNPETGGRYHSDWLTMMYPRLKMARNLLTIDGVIFVSIDDHEYHNLRKICDEIFGEVNNLGTVIWKKVTDNNPSNISSEHESILVYGRSKNDMEGVWKSKLSDIKDTLVDLGNRLNNKYKNQDELQYEYSKWFRENKSQLDQLDRYKYIDKGGIYTGSQSVHNPGKEGYRYDVLHPVTVQPCKEPLMGYRFPEKTMRKLLEEGKILFGDDHEKIIELKVYAKDYAEKLSSVIELDGRLGSYDLKELFPELKKVFTNPKPVRLLSQYFSFVTGPNDIVLDFYSGSATTAHALIALNLEDGGNRKFILVQLPEKTDEKSEAFNAGFKNICEIGKERIRRAGAKIVETLQAASQSAPKTTDNSQMSMFEDENHSQSENQKNHSSDSLDIGFRVYRLDSSNMQDVYYRPQDYKQANLDLFAHNIKPDRTPRDLLAQVMLDWGLPLSYRIEEILIDGKQVFRVAQNSLIACFDNGINEAFAKELATHAPLRVVFRDRSFADDTAKENVKQLLKQLSPETEMRVI